MILPRVTISGSTPESQKLLKEVMKALKKLNIKANVDKEGLNSKGMSNIFDNFLPLLKNNSEYLYWIKDSFDLYVWAEHLIKLGGHHTYLGLRALINKIYDSSNRRVTDRQVWMERLDVWLKTVCDNRDKGQYYINAIYTTDK